MAHTKQVEIIRAVNETQRHVIETNEVWVQQMIADANYFHGCSGVIVYKGDVVRFEKIELELWFDTSARFGKIDKETGVYGEWRRREGSEKLIETLAVKTFAVRKGEAGWK